MAAIGVSSRQKYALAQHNNQNPFYFLASVELDGSNDPTNGFGLNGASVARSATGEYTFTFPDPYPEMTGAFACLLNATTPSAKAEIDSYNTSTGVLTVRVVQSADVPALTAAALTQNGVLTSDAITLGTAGYVVGPILGDGTTDLTIVGTAPATGEVQITYAAGIATLTCNATDAFTDIDYVLIPAAGTVTATDAAVDLNGPRLAVFACFQRSNVLAKTYT